MKRITVLLLMVFAFLASATIDCEKCGMGYLKMIDEDFSAVKQILTTTYRCTNPDCCETLKLSYKKEGGFWHEINCKKPACPECSSVRKYTDLNNCLRCADCRHKFFTKKSAEHRSDYLHASFSVCYKNIQDNSEKLYTWEAVLNADSAEDSEYMAEFITPEFWTDLELAEMIAKDMVPAADPKQIKIVRRNLIQSLSDGTRIDSTVESDGVLTIKTTQPDGSTTTVTLNSSGFVLTHPFEKSVRETVPCVKLYASAMVGSVCVSRVFLGNFPSAELASEYQTKISEKPWEVDFWYHCWLKMLERDYAPRPVTVVFSQKISN